MPKFDVISKGVYSLPQAQNAVPVESFIFIREEEKKYLLVKFTNPRKATLTSLEMKIHLNDARGREVGVVNGTYSFNAPAAQSFISEKFEVPENCVGIKADVISARYGAYVVTGNDDSEFVDYAPRETNKFDVGKALDDMVWENKQTEERTLKRRVLISVVSLLLLIGVFIITAFQLFMFRESETTFLYSGVEYAFADEGKSETSDIYVTGFNGLTSSIHIPEMIEDHKVTKVTEGAFSGNGRIRSLKVDGGLVIEKNAFEGCTSLEKVEVANVTEIGERAFSGCTNLKEFTAGNLTSLGECAFSGCSSLTSVKFTSQKKTLTLGNAAFESCLGLKQIIFDQTVVYPESYSLFEGCAEVEVLQLKNFTTAGKKTLKTLFNLGDSVTGLYNLAEVTIGDLDSFSANFLSNTGVTTLKVSKLGSSVIPASAFEGCVNLSTFNIPLTATVVNQNAFNSTKITTFDFSRVSYIGERAFYASAIDEFSAPELTYLGKEAFAASALTQLNIHNALNEISERAFADCKSLQSVFVPDAILTIGKGAFAGCSALERINLPYIGGSATENTYLAYIFGVERPTSIRVGDIPSTLYEITIRKCSSLPDYAFCGSSGLRKVNLPEGLKSIGQYAYGKCTSLAEITLPETLVGIDSNAFNGCSALKKITIPDSVVLIGLSSFANCSSLEEYTAPYIGVEPKNDENAKLSKVLGGVLDSLKKVTVTKAEFLGDRAFENYSRISEIILPEALKEIGSYAFKDCGFKLIEIPENLTGIGDYAFSGCGKLEKITIPASVTTIGTNPFDRCYRLWEIWNFSSITVTAANAHVFTEEDAGLKKFTVAGYEFGYSPEDDKFILLTFPEDLKAIDLPSNFTYLGEQVQKYEIPKYLFEGNENIVSLTAPAELAAIGEGAFANCKNLASVELSASSLTEIEKDLFSNCGALTSVTLPATVQKISANSFFGCEQIKELILPAALTRIEEDAFSKCSALSYVRFPDGIEYIGARAFKGCALLEAGLYGDKLQEIGSQAFADCSALEIVTLPAPLSAIGEGAFSNCPNLYLVRNYSDLPIEAGNMNYGLVALNAIYVADKDVPLEGSGIHTENNLTFVFCLDDWMLIRLETNIKELNLEGFTFNGKEITSFVIKDGLFQGNSTIEKLIVGAAVKDIGLNTFANTRIKQADFTNSTLEKIPDGAFAYSSSLESLILPNVLESIGNSAFSGCSSLENLNLPSSLKVIGNSAFSGCSKLVSVTFPEGLTTISNGAFVNCSSLKEIALPSSLQTLEDSAFMYCMGVETLTIGENLSEIRSYTFSGLSNIQTVTIPASVKAIDYNAFMGCEKLRVVYNLTNLPIEVHSYEHGGVAYYAVAVFSDLNEKVEFATTGGYEFAKIRNIWYLYRYDNYPSSDSTLILPSASESIPEYVIKQYAFEYKQLAGVVIPDCVKEIEGNVFTVTNLNIYYGGTAEGWESVKTANLPLNTIYYFYVDCVHHANEWMYINNSVSTMLHYYGYSWRVTRPATCAEEGEQEGYCPHCGAVLTKVAIAKTNDHNYDWKVDRAPTCAEEGINHGTCTVCGKEVFESIAKTNDHKYEVIDTKEPTCTESGYERKRCTVCGDIVETELPPKGHDLDENGECKVCGYGKKEEEGSAG